MEITPPEKFSFDPSKWIAWKQRFERFRTASDLTSKAGERQVAILLYSMGEKSEDIFASFKLSEEDGKKYDVVRKRFEDHFIVKKNKRYERSNFNKRTQGENESAESFITAAHKLTETCEYDDLREELICDRIIAGIREQKLATTLMFDDKLTLDKYILQVRQEEQVRKEQEIMNEQQAALKSIENKLRYKQKPTSLKQRASQTSQSTKSMSSQFSHKQPKVQQQQFASSDRCKWCGRDRHYRNSCPALKTKCRACGTMSHFACICRKKEQRFATVQGGSPHVTTEQEQRSYEPVFIDAVDIKDGS